MSLKDDILNGYEKTGLVPISGVVYGHASNDNPVWCGCALGVLCLAKGLIPPDEPHSSTSDTADLLGMSLSEVWSIAGAFDNGFSGEPFNNHHLYGYHSDDPTQNELDAYEAGQIMRSRVQCSTT